MPEPMGALIRSRRDAAQVTQKALAIGASVSLGTIKNAESGRSLDVRTTSGVALALGWAEHDIRLHMQCGKEPHEVISTKAVGLILAEIVRQSGRGDFVSSESAASYRRMVAALSIAPELPAHVEQEFTDLILSNMPAKDATFIEAEIGRGCTPPKRAVLGAEDQVQSHGGRVMLGFSYSPAAHAAVKQLVVSAEIVLADRIKDLAGGPDVYDGNLIELLLALTGLPEDVRGPVDPDLAAIAEEVRRA